MPCGYAVDEVPAKRIKDSIVPGQVGRGNRPLSHHVALPLPKIVRLLIPTGTARVTSVRSVPKNAPRTFALGVPCFGFSVQETGSNVMVS